MARKIRRGSHYAQREGGHFSRPSRLRSLRKLLTTSYFVDTLRYPRFKLTDDGRRFRFGRLATLHTLTQEPVRFATVPSSFLHSNQAFRDPRNVQVCVRRRRRRASLFASFRIGRGIAVTPYRHRTPDSDIRCRTVVRR